MPRVRYDELSRRPGRAEALLVLPAGAGEGYTPTIRLTEWLTLNCRGDWASRVRKQNARVLFEHAADRDRAVAAFGMEKG